VKADLRDDPTVLYNWCVVHNIMLSLLPSIVAGNKIHMVFDKSLPTWRIKEFNAYVENKASYLLFEKGTAFSPDSISSEHVASEREPILQAADAVAGAYFQKYEHQNDEYVRIIEEKVSSFKYLWRK
jgi:5'-3' exonuclease